MCRSLISFVTIAALNLVDIAIRQTTLVQKPAVSMFDIQVQTPEIALVLPVARAIRRFIGVVDHTEMHEMRMRRQPACQGV